MRFTPVAVCAGCAALLCIALLAAENTPQTQHFDADPGWEGYRNRQQPDKAHKVRQDFGYRNTHYARGEKPGEIGGWVQRSITPAWYGKPIAAKTLADKLSFSGRFAVTRDQAPSGTLFGFFNDKLSRGWRTPHSLAVRLDGNGAKYWVFFEYGTGAFQSGCKGCFEGDAYQTTRTKPFAADGTPHDFSLTYDASGSNNDGQVTFVLDGQRYELPFTTGHKSDPTTFNRFGIWNQQTTGDGSEIYLDDLVVNGERMTFDDDPTWQGNGNRVESDNEPIRPFNDFGFAMTSHAGGKPGEVGGLLWRDERPAYYGQKVKPLTLNDAFTASGKVAFTAAGSDSGAYFGWFDSKTKRENVEPEYKRPQRNVLGVLVEGPSRVGHYFRPAYRCADGEGVTADSGPVIRPDGQVHAWSIRYDPGGAGGRGRIIVKFDENVQTLDLRDGEKLGGATFDRFGFFNCQAGGHHVQLYVDDVTYDAGVPAR